MNSNKVKIIGFNCGRQCLHKFSVMGIRIGSELELVSEQPFNGPITVKVGESMVSIGNRMWDKLRYEEVNGNSNKI